jgi:hypothetical protein
MMFDETSSAEAPRICGQPSSSACLPDAPACDDEAGLDLVGGQGRARR